MLRIYPEAFFFLPQDILHSDFNKTPLNIDSFLSSITLKPEHCFFYALPINRFRYFKTGDDSVICYEAFFIPDSHHPVFLLNLMRCRINRIYILYLRI
jgi:hypothetical protein